MADKLIKQIQHTSLSIVIPFHNESGNISELIKRLKATLSQLPNPTEVICVDDNSTDDTRKQLSSYINSDKRFNILSLEKRGGQTGAFNLAFTHSHHDVIIRMDGDLQDSPEDLPSIISKVEEGFDIVIGYRSERKHSLALKLLTSLYDIVIGFILNTQLYSNSSSFVAYKSSLIKGCKLVKNDHRYLPLIAMKRGAKKTTTVTVNHDRRKSGQTKYNLIWKICTAGFELIAFLTRYFSGFYDKRSSHK